MAAQQELELDDLLPSFFTRKLLGKATADGVVLCMSSESGLLIALPFSSSFWVSFRARGDLRREHAR
jgi:hypothetical protein